MGIRKIHHVHIIATYILGSWIKIILSHELPNLMNFWNMVAYRLMHGNFCHDTLPISKKYSQNGTGRVRTFA